MRSKEHRKERRNFAVSRSKSKMKLDAKTYNAQRLDDKADTSPGAKRAVASTPGRSCITVEREEHSVREEREMIVTKDKPCRPKGSSTRVRAKHAAVRTNGKLFERELLSSPVHPCRIRSIPHNLANYTSLVVLLDVLEPFCEAKGYGRGCKPTGGCCSVDGTQLSASSVSDAVGALNRLKRLRNQVCGRSRPAPSHAHRAPLTRHKARQNVGKAALPIFGVAALLADVSARTRQQTSSSRCGFLAAWSVSVCLYWMACRCSRASSCP